MPVKRIQIIEAAIKCFAQKGFHAASIKDIVDEVGIAKGSLYLYFKSKEELLIASIEYILQQIRSSLSESSHTHQLDPREKLSQIITDQLRFSLNYRDFISILMNESVLHHNENIHSTLFDLRIDAIRTVHSCIIDIYGDAVRPYAMDAASALQALISHYTSHVLIDKLEFVPEELQSFLMDMLDDVIAGMTLRKQKPILTETLFGALKQQQKKPEHWSESIREITQLAEELEQTDKNELLLYLRVLENELQKPEPLKSVVQGMTSYLQKFNSTSLKKPIKDLLDCIDDSL